MSQRLLLAHVINVFLAAYCSAQHTEQVYLSGTDKDHTVDWQFQCTSGARSGEWTTIPVPSHWDVLGFGSLNYKKDIGSALEERGLYKHTFEAAKDWEDERVLLVFEGVMTDTTVKLNGQTVGPTHQGGFYRFQYDVSDFLKFGEKNLLEVDVAKHSANESVNKAERTADFWVFGGIYRPVYLKIVPNQFIERVAIDAQANGEFSAEVFSSTNTSKNIGPKFSIEAQVKTIDGEPVSTPFGVETITPGSNSSTTVAAKFDSPQLWSAEKPNLYQVEFRLKRGSEVLHSTTERFGFRTVEVRADDGIYVNGQKVVLKGVNRHSTWPDSGRCLSEAVHRLDIETIQGMNMNAVRMSHYPPDPQFLDLCDELGLYVLDELAGWHWHYDTQIGSQLVKELVTRDVNHPAVLFWDNGNEGGFNYSLDEQFGWYDPQHRTVLHPWEAFNHVNTAHYLEFDRAEVASKGVPTRHGTGEVYQEWEDVNDPNKYIYMPTEMLHGLYDGGSGAGLEAYWEMMRQSPVLGGAFLWVLFDEGIKRADGTIDCAGNQAPDGIVGPYREREASFYTIQEIWSPVQVSLSDKSSLEIKNEYSFTDVSECKLTWQLRKFSQLDDPEAGYEVLAEGEPALPSIAPGKKGTLQLDLPNDQHSADCLAVRIDNPQGRELWTWVWPLSDLPPKAFMENDNRLGSVVISSTEKEISAVVGDLQVAIDKQSGMLEGVRRGDQKYSLSNGPEATTVPSSLISLNHRMENEVALIEGEFSGGLRSVTWAIHPSGWIDCTYAYQAKGESDYFGVTFDYPAEFVQGKKWLGNGPFRVWKNRRRGGTLGVWENEQNETITGYSEWDYPEFAGCFSDVHWMRLQTSEGPITVVPHDRESYLQVLLPEQPPEDFVGKTKFELPQCGIALLDAIPAVGSKFKTPETTGPRGQPNVGKGIYEGKVSFYFGE
ncbi:glycoside hydrolase family 2 TIM barrel-domain containing protein [Bythopirellula goksoeyrii]|uniref:glycoside hydrolase family 2 TIM barrel-domain containing protein n=1 Tax=Bythopirellula goksoeyrii TaxID=1400387 RepID=UPI00143D8530|nr:glycoside hydrolase family 2 TIM barrel-domain containing protein [Bythopirellula goksoeyrii]